GAAAFAGSARRRGLVVSGRASYQPGGGGARAALERLAKTRPDAVVVMDDTLGVANVLRWRSGLGWGVPVVAGPLSTDQAALSAIGEAGRGGVYAVVPAGVVVRPGTPSGGIRAFRDSVLHHLRRSSMDGSVVAFARGYDAVRMLANAASGANATGAGDIRSYLESSGYQGLLASYSYSSSAHTGIPASQSAVVDLSSLANGLFTGP
ncbi:MAG: ABC transporter substrate-binding protein, partial [Acidimicrobiales bacterium]